MANVVLYLDARMATRIDKAAQRAGKSRSAWVRELVAKQLDESPEALPEWWWKNLGTWEDDRSPGEILEDIDANLIQTDEPEFE